MARTPKGVRLGGLAKGTSNKVTAQVRDAILQAFDAEGGVDYLRGVAKRDPKTFCTLLGKVLPTQITGDEDNPVSTITRIEFAAADVDSKD